MLIFFFIMNRRDQGQGLVKTTGVNKKYSNEELILTKEDLLDTNGLN